MAESALKMLCACTCHSVTKLNQLLSDINKGGSTMKELLEELSILDKMIMQPIHLR